MIDRLETLSWPQATMKIVDKLVGSHRVGETFYKYSLVSLLKAAPASHFVRGQSAGSKWRLWKKPGLLSTNEALTLQFTSWCLQWYTSLLLAIYLLT